MPFKLYNSSAGSGKTYSLVIEYLSIVLNDTRKFKRVIAVTFTNKAALEMKSRIVEYLIKISEGKMPKAVQSIINISKSELSEGEIKDNSKIILTKILHNYSDFAVKTIDSFLTEIVSTFAIDLKLPLNFDIDMDINNILKKTVNNLIRNANSQNYIGEIIIDYVLSKIKESKSWNTFDEDIINVGKEIFTEKSIDYLDELSKIDKEVLNDLSDKLDEEIENCINEINNEAKRAIDIIEKNGLSIEDFYGGTRGIAGKFHRLSNARSKDELKLTNTFLEGNPEKWVTKNSPNKEKIEGLRDSHLDNIRIKIIETRKKYITLYLIRKNFPLTSLIRELKVFVEDYKTENSIVPISDFNKIIGDIIKKEVIPFIYWRVGNKFENYLLDEFQDTSTLQLKNLFPLIEESFASGNRSIAVGDPKQCIYRWRNSDPEIMGNGLNDLIDKSFFETKRLEYNYRSSKNIIEFNNKFFSNLNSSGRGFDFNIYNEENLVQESPDTARDSGFVEIVKYESKDKSFREFSLENTIRIIKDLLDDGFGYGDITILTRTNNEGNIIAEGLFKNNIEVISPDALFLNNSPKIRFIISVLNYLVFGEDLFLIEIARYLFQSDFEKIIENEINKIKIIIKERFPKIFDADTFKKANLYDTVEKIIEFFKLNTENVGYIQSFLEFVFEFSEKYQNEIYTFLKYWEEKKESSDCTMKLPDGSNAVTIMTIHKAKGLEFPVVIIPFANWSVNAYGRGNIKNTIWVRDDEGILKNGIPLLVDSSKDLAESFFSETFSKEEDSTVLDNFNLLYVAFTRAIERLYLCIAPKNSGKNISNIISEISDIIGMQTNNDKYTCGNRDEHERKEVEKEKNISDIISSSWENKVSIKNNSSEIWGDEERDEEITESIERGKIIHKILSEIKIKEDKDRVIKSSIYSGIITEEEAKSISSEIENIFDMKFEDGKFSDLFSDKYKVYCERPILSKRQELKPDRVVIKEAQTIVIEYKTGMKNEKYSRQVEKYCSVLKEMGYENVSGYIVYIGIRDIERVV